MEERLRRSLKITIYQLVLGTVMRDSLHSAESCRWSEFRGKKMPADEPNSLSHCWYQGLNAALGTKGQKKKKKKTFHLRAIM